MSTLDATRAELALIVLYLNKAEARDKICRAIQYGSKFVSNGEPGTAQNVDKSTSLARKVFRLFKVGWLWCKFLMNLCSIILILTFMFIPTDFSLSMIYMLLLVQLLKELLFLLFCWERWSFVHLMSLQKYFLKRIYSMFLISNSL